MQRQRNQKISKFFTFFILLVICITGIYQSYVLADSLFVCQNSGNSFIYEKSLIDSSQDVYLEESSPLEQLTFFCKENRRSIFPISNLSHDIDATVVFLSKNFILSFTDILRENCISHFSCMVITDYLHLKDGQKNI